MMICMYMHRRDEFVLLPNRLILKKVQRISVIYLYWHHVKVLCEPHCLCIVTYLVTIDGVWIDNRIYWALENRNYN
jgi:hypothetical protein